MTSTIVTEISSRCNCDFTENHIRKGGFLCFPSSSQAITYRGELRGTTQASASDLITYMEDWVASNNVTILVKSQWLTVDSSCSVAIASVRDPECVAEREEPSPNVEESSPTVGIIVGVVLAAVVLVVVVIVVIVMAVSMYRSRWATVDIK